MFLSPRAISFALALAGALTASQAAAQNDREGRVSFFMYASSGWNTVPKEVIADYLKAHPKVKIDISEGTNSVTYPKMVTTRRTTPDDPLIHCGYFNPDAVFKGDVDDMWESLNPERIPNMNNVLESFARPNNQGIGYMTMGLGILYNTNVVKEPPTSWSVLWDPKNKGKVVAFDNNLQLMALASKLNGGDENNMDPGFKVWAEAAGNFKALVDSNDALKNLLVSGDAPYSMWFSSVADVWTKEGAPLGFAAPKEGAIAWPVYLNIVKGVTDQERAICEDLINIILSAERATQTATLTSSIPLVTNAEVSQEMLANPMLNPALAENAIHLDWGAIARNTVDWKDRWAREVKSKMR